MSVDLRLSPTPAQLVGMGCSTVELRGFVDLPRAAMPPGIQANVDKITPTLTTGSSAGPVTTAVPCACADGSSGVLNAGVCGCAPAKKTNWLLYGGIGLGVVVLGALLLRD